MSKYIKITNNLYPFKIHVILDIKDPEVFFKTIKFKRKKDAEDFKRDSLKPITDMLTDETWEGFCYSYKGNIIIVVKKFDISKPLHIESLCHEVTHAVFKAADYIGMEHDYKSEEFYSYLTGYIMKKIFEELYKKKNS